MTDTAPEATPDTVPDSAAPEAAARPRLGLDYAKLWTASVVTNLGDGVAQIAYPWLASAVTRDPILIAVIAVVQRLPWLLFTLPAGVITDRVDRRRIMVAMDVLRTIITLAVAAAVVAGDDRLPSPEDIAGGIDISTDMVLYLVLVVSALLLGCAEVLRDNSAQTILPSIVAPEALEKANGRMWGAEMVANSFAGPPLGSLLIGVMFALPFFFDAGTFAVAAGLVFLISGDFRTNGGVPQGRVSWRREISEGFGWLWRHPLLKPMAIVLGLLNALNSVTFATFVLFAQEVLGVDSLEFALLLASGAIGGILASFTASRISQTIGSGPSLYATMLGGAVTALVIGVSSSWPPVWAMLAAGTFAAVLWNVITVSLRQTIIPDRLLGRVNSVYRFFGWGMMPIGLGLGGIIVSLGETFAGRETALRLPWLFAGLAYLVVFAWAAPKLTTAKMERARSEGIARKAQQSAAAGGDDPADGSVSLSK